MASIFKLPGVGPATAAALSKHGITTAERLAGTSPEVLLAIPRIGPSRIKTILAAAQRAVSEDAAHVAPDPAAIRKPRRAAPKAPAATARGAIAKPRATQSAAKPMAQPTARSGIVADGADESGAAAAGGMKKKKGSGKAASAEMQTEAGKAAPGSASSKADKKKATEKKEKKKSGKKKSKKTAAKKKDKKAGKK